MNQNDTIFPGFDAEGFKLDGLTKREYAAIKIMAGLAAFPETLDTSDAADIAVTWTDALFKELEKTNETQNQNP